MSISVAITTYNRWQMTIDCFAQIIDNDFISEFIIVDDASTDGSDEILKTFFKNNPKVKVFVNKENLGMSRNKELAIRLCKEQFVLIVDSDNTFYKESIDALLKISLDENVIYCPDWGRPAFNYKKFSDKKFNKKNVHELANDPMGNCCLNTANYLVPRKQYLDTYSYNPLHRASDTIWFNYLWLKGGATLFIVADFEYNHLQHPGSGYLEDLEYNLEKSKEVKNLILLLQ